MMDDEAVDDSTEGSLDAIGLLKIIRCKKADRGLPCMMQCAEAGISCAAKRPHPKEASRATMPRAKPTVNPKRAPMAGMFLLVM